MGLAQIDSASVEPYNPNEFADADESKKYCTQKVLNQAPTKLIGVAYEMNLGFVNKNSLGSDKINSMGGLRTNISILAISTNKLILSAGATYWGSKIHTDATVTNPSLLQTYSQTLHLEGFNLLLFKPLNERNFIIAQANVDASYISHDDTWRLTKPSVTYYGSAIYGWKKGDQRMLGVGLSRTYRLGRPLFVPILLYNETYNDHWGVEFLLPARAHVRYNFSTNQLLMAGYELEGQQFDLSQNSQFLQRGEIKPRLVYEQKLKGAFWASLQVGYRINGRFNFVDRYNGKEKNEVFINNLGGAPYFNFGINFVSP
jgi:hypothetical protein